MENVLHKRQGCGATDQHSCQRLTRRVLMNSLAAASRLLSDNVMPERDLR